MHDGPEEMLKPVMKLRGAKMMSHATQKGQCVKKKGQHVKKNGHYVKQSQSANK